MTSPIAKLGHVAAHTPDLEQSLWFFRDVIGLHVVEREEDTAYLRGQRDWEHHTLSLTESGQTGIDHIAFRARSQEALDALAEQFETNGMDVTYLDPGDTEAGQGSSIRIEKFGHPYEFYYDVEKPQPPEEKRSKLKNRGYSEATANRIAVRRIDHAHVQDSTDVAVEHADWLKDVLGFQLNERYWTDDEPLGLVAVGHRTRPRYRDPPRTAGHPREVPPPLLSLG